VVVSVTDVDTEVVGVESTIIVISTVSISEALSRLAVADVDVTVKLAKLASDIVDNSAGCFVGSGIMVNVIFNNAAAESSARTTVGADSLGLVEQMMVA